jgi:hypothetical protein
MRIPGFPRALCTRAGAATLVAGVLCALPGAGATLNLEVAEPLVDYWSYPFASAPGQRLQASTFGAVGSQADGFDNRDAQFLFSFVTSGASGVPTGQALENYKILSAKVTLTVAAFGAFYDPTYDPISTYGAGGESINGDDPGRPMELYGVGYRNGVTASTFSESTPFTTAANAQTQGVRSAYVTDFLAGGSLNGNSRDVSNNVTGKGAQTPFDPKPFAIGQVAAGDLSGNEIDEDATVTFTLDLTNADVVKYLRLSLQLGRLALGVSSLDLADRAGGVTYPIFYTGENISPTAVPPQLSIQVEMVPEPSAVTLSLCGVALLAAGWRGGRALRKPNDLP